MKKGMLLAEETTKIILAVISIGFLVFLLYNLYYQNSVAEKQEHAQSLLDKIVVDYKSLVDGGEINYSNPTPAGWSFFSFIGNDKPGKCTGINCVCICSETLVEDGTLFTKSQSQECAKNGVCLIMPIIESFSFFEIDSTKTIFMKKTGGKISFEQK